MISAVPKMFDMLPADAYMPDGRTAADSASVQSLVIIRLEKKTSAIYDLSNVCRKKLC
jgi:hypothetical protein